MIFLSQAEFARKCNVRPQSITHAIKKGIIKVNRDGEVDSECESSVRYAEKNKRPKGGTVSHISPGQRFVSMAQLSRIAGITIQSISQAAKEKKLIVDQNRKIDLISFSTQIFLDKIPWQRKSPGSMIHGSNWPSPYKEGFRDIPGIVLKEGLSASVITQAFYRQRLNGITVGKRILIRLDEKYLETIRTMRLRRTGLAMFKKGIKKCPHCKIVKPFSDFYSNLNLCKKCSMIAKRKYDQTEKGKLVREKIRARRRKPISPPASVPPSSGGSP